MSGSESMNSVGGFYHPPLSARAIPARLSGSHGRFIVTPETGEPRDETADGIEITPRIAGVPRRIEFTDGAAFITRDDDGLEAVLGAAASRGAHSFIARLERPSVKLIVFGSAAVLAIVAGIRWGVPIASSAMAALTPHAVSAEIGAGSLAAIDRIITKPTALASTRQSEIAAVFDKLAAAGGLTGRVELNFRKGGAVGPNAFAMAGGVIVLTDELVKLSKSTEEVAGVLAHEIAHAEYRHPEQTLWQTIGFGLALTVLFGDAGTLAEEAAAAGSILVERAYSREHETEADLRAVELMQGAGMAPGHFVIALERLHDECGIGCKETTWLSSHPGGDERLAALCSALADPGPASDICKRLPAAE